MASDTCVQINQWSRCTVPVRGDGVDGTPGVPRPRPTGVGPAPAPFSELDQYSRNATPTRSESAQNRNSDHPAPSLMETSRFDGAQERRRRER